MFSCLRRDILKTIIPVNGYYNAELYVFKKSLVLIKHKLHFVAVEGFIDKMTDGKQDQRFESL